MGGIPYLETIHFVGSMLNLGSGNSLGLVLSLPSDAGDATSDHPDYFAVFGACKDMREQNLAKIAFWEFLHTETMCPTDLSSRTPTTTIQKLISFHKA